MIFFRASRVHRDDHVRCNMTPTRTDTTPRKERRAFKPMNNTRPHLRPRTPGACSAVTTSINDEHGSNGMCGGYTREQLIHWVMSKDAVASCFIKDVLSMSESENGGETHLLAFLFLTHPNSTSNRTSLLFSWACALQISFPSCHRSRSCGIRTSRSLHP